MIRIVVLVLLGLNLLYLGWSHWIDSDPAQLTAVTVGTKPAAARAPAAPPGPPPCATIGPLSDEALALQTRQKLEAAGWGVLRREVTETLHDGWWVHVDNTDQKQQARTLGTLERAGIKDAFAMPDDPQFRVSVGIFSVEARAEDRAAQAQKLKLDAVVSERLKEQVTIWLDVPGVARETMNDGRLVMAGIAADKLRVETCPPAAAVAPGAPAGPGAAIIPAP
jgi:hypothetical protein